MMYHSYNSLKDAIQKEIESQQSVLSKFPENISRPITQTVSSHLAKFTSYQLPYKSDGSTSGALSAAKQNFIGSNVGAGPSANSGLDSLSSAALMNSSIHSSNIGASASASQSSSSTTSHSQLPGKQQLQSQQNRLSTTVSGASGQGSGSGSNDPSSAEKQNIIQFDTPEQVNWTLENLMYGLTLAHEHQEIIKDCWSVYHDWLSVLLDEPKQFVPQAIKDDPITYAKKMLWHLYHLFVPRKDPQAPTKHIMLCHGVLIVIESISKDSKLLQRDLWEEFLKFVLAINDAVLAPPFNKDDFGDALGSRIVATLFEIWLIACSKCFPSPALWKTFQELCANWRHHISLVIEWNRVCYALTNRLLELIWWPESGQQSKHLALTQTNDTNVACDIHSIISEMSTETVIQAWFRFFHIIGKPVDFCDIASITKTNEFIKAAHLQQQLQKDSSLDTNAFLNFYCIKRLPTIFLEAIKGISRIVDLYLGLNLPNQIGQNQLTPSGAFKNTSSSSLNPASVVGASSSSVVGSLVLSTSNTVASTNQMSASMISETTKLRAKSMLVTSSSNNDDLMTQSHISTASFINFSTVPVSNIIKLNPYKINRPTVNSLLHLFGQWLFEAAINNQHLQHQSHSNRDYVLGQAEAYGILCKIFCSVKSNEKILPEYLSRFYSLLLIGLRVPNNFGDYNSHMEYENGEILASIIANGYNLFKLDLDGANILLGSILNALNVIFKLKYPQKEDTATSSNKPGISTDGAGSAGSGSGSAAMKAKEYAKSTFNIGSNSITLVELKRFCIHILSSLLSIPNQFSSLNIYNEKDPNSTQTFYSLRFKILEIFLVAIGNELDNMNLQMLFGCGRLIVGEWSIDELNKCNNGISIESLDKKERASYCYNQVVSLICAPLKINNTTLQNHSFALSIFDSLASIAAGDASTSILNEDDSVCKLSISWILHYVKTQIKRRSREHTREMHSVIVAAYNCLIALLIKKPSLLRDKMCLQTVTNCIEIGISGSSSYPEQKHRDENKENNATLMKADKELKPASLRVKEAAECLLCLLMEHTSFSRDLQKTSPLDEKSMLEICSRSNLSKFKYFAIDGSLIMAISEKSFGSAPSQSNNSNPSVTILLRGPFGRQAWSLHLRTSPFNSKNNADYASLIASKTAASVANTGNNSVNINNVSSMINTSLSDQEGAPQAKASSIKPIGSDSSMKSDETSLVAPLTPSTTNSQSSAAAPASTNGASHVANISQLSSANSNTLRPKCEQNIPTLNEVASKCFSKNLEVFHRIKQTQIEFETNAFGRILNENNSINRANGAVANTPANFIKPRTNQDVHSARMLLTHLGFCSLEPPVSKISLSKSESDNANEIVSIDSTDPNFYDQLINLDYLSTRTFASCQIFYIKKNQSSAKSILSNINTETGLDESFYLFLQSLGSILDVTTTMSPTGASSESNRRLSSELNNNLKKLNKINGSDNVIYWSDISNEIVFTLPNCSSPSSSKTEPEMKPASPPLPPPASQHQAGQLKSLVDETLKIKLSQPNPHDLKVLVVWLEQMQDADSMPIDALLAEISSASSLAENPSQHSQSSSAGQIAAVKSIKEINVIFVHPLKSGMYRISTWNNINKKYFYTTPLIDGMVVSSKMLSSMIRQTALNMFKRKRLEMDDYQPPHVRRKNKITEIIKKFQTKKAEADLYTALLMGTI